MKPCESISTGVQLQPQMAMERSYGLNLSHIVNQHTNLDDPLFNKCVHADIPHRTWINPGMCNL